MAVCVVVRFVSVIRARVLFDCVFFVAVFRSGESLLSSVAVFGARAPRWATTIIDSLMYVRNRFRIVASLSSERPDDSPRFSSRDSIT